MFFKASLNACIFFSIVETFINVLLNVFVYVLKFIEMYLNLLKCIEMYCVYCVFSITELHKKQNERF